MVLDPIPQSLPVHFCGSRPQPPTSPPDVCLACGCFHACRCTMFLYYMYYVYFIFSMCYSTHSTHIILHILYATIAILCVLCVLHIFYTSHSSMLHLWAYSLLHLECHVISISNLNLLGLFSTERGTRDLEP